MSRRISFSQYLLGHASLERPPFFYAYSGMWLHLIIGTGLLALFGTAPLLTTLSSVVVGSFCLGIVAYGLFSREYGLLVNLASYASSMGRIFTSEALGSLFLLVAIIIALVSGYQLLSREYRTYSREVHNDQKGEIPLWITLIMGTVTILLCIFGLYLF